MSERNEGDDRHGQQNRGAPQSADGTDYRAFIASARGPVPRTLVPFASRSRDSVFDKQMVARLMVAKYRNRWHDLPLFKDAVALHIYVQLLMRVRPRVIFDLGTAAGGSALWFSAQCRCLGLDDTRVITMDIEDFRGDECKKLMRDAGNIEFILGDLNDARDLLPRDLAHPWLIAEDCHVDAACIVDSFRSAGLAVGDYILFEDTHPANPDDPGMSAADMDNYTCDRFATDKYAKLERALLRGDDGDDGGDGDRRAEFAVDTSLQDLYGYNGATFVNSVIVKQR